VCSAEEMKKEMTTVMKIKHPFRTIALLSGIWFLAPMSSKLRAEVLRPPLLADDAAAKARLRGLNAFVLPEIRYVDLPAAEVIADLERLGAESGTADGLRISFCPELASDTRITFGLKAVPWPEAVRYASSLAGAVPTVRDGGIELVTMEDERGLSVEVIELDEAAARFVAASRVDEMTLAQALESTGVEMPQGSSVVFNPETSQLVVRHSDEGRRRVKAWLEGGKLK
jgi:hypothetical protein